MTSKETQMAHDQDYFRRRAAEARAECFRHPEHEDAEVAGQLALAFAALAKRRQSATADQSLSEKTEA